MTVWQQLDDLQTVVDNTETVPVFGYKASALNTDAGIEGHNEYSDNNDNNIPLADGTQLSLQEIEKGFRDNISTLSRAFFTHFFGRSSFNINKMRSLLSEVLETCKADYTHNFRAWDSTAVYNETDVCFLVAYGIRYCFKSLVDNNTAVISAAADGTLNYDDTKWSLLTEVRAVQHPVGEPFLWFGGNLPGNYICFSDGSKYTWAQYPELNNPQFKALLTRFTWKGARANDTDFTVPNISELYPMCTDIPDQLSTIAAKVPAHYHSMNSGIVNTNSTKSTGHTHPVSTTTSGSHRHYTGDYYSDILSVAADGAWHEDSKFRGAYEYTTGGEDGGSETTTDYTVYLTPKLADVTMAKHTYSTSNKTLPHNHSGAVTTSGTGDFGEAQGKYRPGTVKTILAIRAS